MKIPSATAGGLAAIQQGMAGLERNAAAIARSAASPETPPPADALVEARQNRLQVETGAKVVESTDRMLGSLLDEHA